jgi:hypothetical protein
LILDQPPSLRALFAKRGMKEAAVWTASSLFLFSLADVHDSIAALDQCAGRATPTLEKDQGN